MGTQRTKGSQARGKRVVTGVYSSGNMTLFVPALRMWRLREVAIAAGKAPKRRSPTFQGYLNFYKGFPWFQPWLQGGELPARIRVPTSRDVERALAAWSYSSIVRTARGKTGPGQYGQWFRDSVFPRLSGVDVDQDQRRDHFARWIGWLYGDAAPDGWMMVPEWAVQLRNELTPGAICKESKVRRHHFVTWRRNPLKHAALLAAMAAAGDGGGEPKGSEAWDRLFVTPRPDVKGLENGERSRKLFAWSRRLVMRDAMLRFSAQAVESKALERVQRRLDTGKGPSDLRKQAKKLEADGSTGIEKALQEWLHAGLHAIKSGSMEQRYGRWGQRGVVAAGLFIPYQGMWDFRKAAEAVGTKENVRGLRNRCGQLAPLWFLDWTLPLPHKGKRSKYRVDVGLTGNYFDSPLRTAKASRAEPSASEFAASIDENDGVRLDAARGRCKSEGQRRIVEAVARLTAGRAAHWPEAKEIAKAAGVGCNTYFYGTVLPLLRKRGALKKRDAKNGYRLA